MATNGTLTPPSLPPAPASPGLAKRKHAATHSIIANGASATQGKFVNGSTYSLQLILEDILSILKSYDTKPSILEHPITSSISRAPSGEADSKRAKLTPSPGPTTVASLIQDGSYPSLQSFGSDLEKATSDILASVGPNDAATVVSAAEKLLHAKVLAFRQVATSILDREGARYTTEDKADVDAEGEADSPQADDIIAQIKDEEAEGLQSRTVLTLYGGSAPPKQLFSSLQQPYKVSPANGSSALDTAVKVILPLRETNLPNLISTTEVYPLPDAADGKKKTATIGETFRAPAHLPQISPPKSNRPSTSKGNSTITFAPPETTKTKRKGSQSYSHQNLSSGFWLGYGGVDMPKDQTSPTAKQKSRQRALSMGEAQQPPSEAILVAVQQAKEDALFRSVYSSFAPSRDESSAIVPEEMKNMVWWQKVGEKRFNETFPIDPALEDTFGTDGVEDNGTVDDEEGFKQAVEEFVPVEAIVFDESEEGTQEEKDTDELLKETSELIETLASYQRIRNSSLTTNPRTPVVQNSSLASLAGSPSTPSTDEVDVYQILKSQLTLLISQLPPYAVAKLNGDQMAELNISRTIVFDTKEYKGVLEEDQLSKLSKAAPALPATTPATLARSSSGGHAHYPGTAPQYGRTNSATLQSGARPVYPQQQQSLHRSSSMHVQRSPSNPSQTFQTGAMSYGSAARPNYAGTPSYSQQTPRPTYGSTYGTNVTGQYGQRSAQPAGYSTSTAPQYYGATPQTQNRYTHQQNQNGYYSRSQNVAPMYNPQQTPQARTVSPLKNGGVPNMNSFGARPTYGTPVTGGTASGSAVPGGAMRSTYYGTYGATQAPSTPAAYNGMASSTQQLMMDRQHAQVAAQSQARLAAQNSFSSRQGSGTPQPPNNSYSGQSNGVSTST